MQLRLVVVTLGALAAILGLFMMSAVAWAWYYGDGTAELLSAVALGFLVGGSLIFSLLRIPHASYNVKDGFAVVTFGWILAGVIGALPFFLTGGIPSFVDALFESVSGFTTTGATVISDIERVPRGVLFWRSLTHWLGGMGIVVLSVAILPLLGVGGMAMFKAEVPSPVMDKLKPRVAETAKTLWLVYIGMSALEVLLLCIGGMGLFDALCHTFGTVATGGFSTKNASLAHYNSVYLELVVTAFMFLAGVNFTLHYRALCGAPGAYWNSLEFRTYVVVFLICSLFIALRLLDGSGVGFGQALRQATFQVTSIMTTTGFVTADWEKWPWDCQWVLLSLMFMGGCGGSTGGGMKCMRLIVTAKHVFREFRLLVHPRAIIPLKLDGVAIASPVVNSIVAFIALFVGVWACSTLLLIMLGLDVITAIGATTATLSNVGPGLNAVGAFDNYSELPELAKLLLTFNMLVGRLELYTVFLLLTPEFWRR